FNERYSVKQKLGVGAYGIVREATLKFSALMLSIPFAIKRVQRAGLTPEDVRDLRGEVGILAKLNHPNVVKVFGFYEEPQRFFVVMEIVRGGELFDRIVEKVG
ncbi:unnamed protein product, partial [Phaeothamnion confervicola]